MPSRTALLIIGHGSTLNPDSSTPTHAHADEIRRRGLFDEVCCAFWKEEPSMREIFYAIESEVVFIVPNFISEGYFTREVLPREMGLDGAVTHRQGKTLYYCDPVGTHPGMTRLLLERAAEVAPNVPREATSLVIVGHGTGLNEQSRKAIEAQVSLIREGGSGFAEVVDAYMEEAPLVAKWAEITTAPHVVVVPFFIADGLHSYQDIPVLLGIESEPTSAASQNDVFRHNPHELQGRRLYYSSAIGTEALLADVILDQVGDLCARHGLAMPQAPEAALPSEALPSHTAFRIGQIQISPTTPAGEWILHHVGDSPGDPTLAVYKTPADARTLALYNDAGEFRSLKTAPNLRRGWLLCLSSESDLRLALDFLYPGEVGLWRHWQAESLRPVHLRETLGRQTGMYRFASRITDEQAQELIACHCDAQTHCLRRITWGLTDEQPLTTLTPEKLPPSPATFPKEMEAAIPLICVEACTHIVSAAREAARQSQMAAKPGEVAG